MAGQTKEAYDVVFVSRTSGTVVITKRLVENVDKDAAIACAQQYCHRGALDDGVMIVCHGTVRSPEGAEWWFSCGS